MNKPFSAFFAEFQRLGIEGEMTNDSLVTLLKTAINHELKDILKHDYYDKDDFLGLAAHL